MLTDSGVGGGGIAWRAQVGPQAALVSCPVNDIFFGGARGGGKTDGLLGDAGVFAARQGPHFFGALFRRTYPELERVIARSLEVYTKLGWRYNETKKKWWTPDGGSLVLRYLDADKDASNYQGHEWTYLGMDELTNWPNPDPIDKLRACLRSPHGMRCVFRASGNPGGPGHTWVKQRYVDHDPRGYVPFEAPLPGGLLGETVQRVYIPATLDDNPALNEADPGYWHRIVQAVGGNQALLRAWRYGDWNIVSGGFFDDVWNAPVLQADGSYRPSHKLIVVPSFEPPETWRLTRSFDWGSSKPFSVGWWGVSDGNPAVINGSAVHFKRGSLVRLCELYGWTGQANHGVHWTVSTIAAKMREAEEARGWTNRVQPGPADPAIFATQNGMCIAEDFRRAGIAWMPADMRRSGALASARANGWAKMRSMLAASTQWPMEEPGLFITDACTQFIRTVPALPRDDVRVEDVDTDSEDHVADETRYMCTTPLMPRTTAQVKWG